MFKPKLLNDLVLFNMTHTSASPFNSILGASTVSIPLNVNVNDSFAGGNGALTYCRCGCGCGLMYTGAMYGCGCALTYCCLFCGGARYIFLYCGGGGGGMVSFGTNLFRFDVQNECDGNI